MVLRSKGCQTCLPAGQDKANKGSNLVDQMNLETKLNSAFGQ